MEWLTTFITALAIGWIVNELQHVKREVRAMKAQRATTFRVRGEDLHATLRSASDRGI